MSGTISDRIVQGIRNAFGFGRKGGRTGAVAAALAAFALIAAFAVSAVGESQQADFSNDDVYFEPPEKVRPVPSDLPETEKADADYFGAPPSRLPC